MKDRKKHWKEARKYGIYPESRRPTMSKENELKPCLNGKARIIYKHNKP